MQFLRARGIDVPGQISVAGAGQVVHSLSVPVDLTVIDVQFDQMCRVAVELLQELIKDTSMVARRTIVEPRINVGATAVGMTATAGESNYDNDLHDQKLHDQKV